MLHIADDSFLQPEPGVSAGDHLLSGLVPLGFLSVAALIFLRVRAGARAVLALLIGLTGVVVGFVEAGSSEHRPPARTGQPASDSTSPQVDVAPRLGGDGPAVGDVGELQHAAGAQHAVDLIEHGALVGAQVDHPVGDHRVGPSVLDG